MPEISSKKRMGHSAWRIAGQWMVVLALGLAGVAIVLALLQVRSFTARLMDQARLHAGRIGETVDERFEHRVAFILRMAGGHLRFRPEHPWGPFRRAPGWLDGVYGWDGMELVELSESSGDAERERAFAESFLSGLSPSDDDDDDFFGVRVTHVPRNGETAVMAWRAATGLKGTPMAVAAKIDVQQLRIELVEPLIPSHMELATEGPAGVGQVLAPAGWDHKPWTRPILGTIGDWRIVPTDAFVREQRQAMLGQTLVYLGITTLAVLTLLTAIAVLVRLVRREMALAQMKSDFVADVSHELKTPLALIRMFGETLQSGRVDSEGKRQEYYAIITRESTRLSNLIDNLLDFARIDADRKVYNLEPTDLAAVVRETFEAYRPQLEHNGFEHHLRIREPLPAVDADRDAIAQAIINLMNNAIKYCGDERHLAIDMESDTRRNRHGVLISVHDRGIGIRPEYRARVFDGFFRAPDGRVQKQGGAGLGLALVRHIVDAHGGSIDMESRLVKGSTFRIFLPAAMSTRAT